MKKIKSFLILMLIAAFAVTAYRYNLETRKKDSRQGLDGQTGRTEVEKVKNLVDETAIVKKSLKAVGILGLLEGKEEYKQHLEEENWYSYRGINIDWHYKFSIAINLDDLDVDVSEGSVNINVDDKKLFVWFIEKTGESMSKSQASWLAKKFSSQEIEVLEKAVYEKIEEKIKNNDNYRENARKSLEANITRLCSELGYNNVNFSYKNIN